MGSEEISSPVMISANAAEVLRQAEEWAGAKNLDNVRLPEPRHYARCPAAAWLPHTVTRHRCEAAFLIAIIAIDRRVVHEGRGRIGHHQPFKSRAVRSTISKG